MKKNTPISTIMTKNIVYVKTSQNLNDAYQLIKDKKIRHLPVVSGDKVVGILSKTDIDKASFINASVDKEDFDTTVFEYLQIEQVMSTHLKTVQENDTIYDTAVLIAQNEFHAVPVLREDTLVGIVTSTDLIKYLIDSF